jgi:OPT family oligopeptide transporter
MRKNKVQAATINHKYSDRLNILQRAYREVPAWWFISLFVAQFVIMIILLAMGYFYIPVWAYFIALLSGAAVVIPMGWLYAISNFTVNIMAFNEMLYGYMINTGLKNHHPAGVLTYGAIAGDAWVTAHSMLQDMKVGHYMHVPPRTIFFAQLFGSLIGIPINYGVIKWIIADKGPYLLGKKKDPLNQWTGQRLSQANTMAVQYVLVGPKRLFALPMYHLLPLGFFVGMVAPLILFGLHRRWPKVRFDLCNATIFFAGLSKFYGNISTGNVSKFIGGYIVMRYAYRRRFEMWKRYNYIMAAAFDAGFNFNMMIIFIAFSSIKVVQMPHWFGNNAQSVERCFALPKEGGHHGGHHGGADGTFTVLSATNGTGMHNLTGHGHHHHHHNTTQFKFF